MSLSDKVYLEKKIIFITVLNLNENILLGF